MDAPPPLPPRRISAFLLVSLLFTIIAVGMTAALCTTDDWVPVPWQRLTLTIAGSVAATMAGIFGVAALFDRRKAWPLAFFTGLVSCGALWFLIQQWRQPVRDILGQMGRTVRENHAEGMKEARQAIPQSANAPTGAKVQPLLVAWGETAMVRPYEEHGHHDPKWDDAARKFIRGTALLFAGGLNSPGMGHLQAMGVELEHLGCDDPWVLFLIHRLQHHDPEFQESMAKSAADLAAARYPAFPLWLARAEVVRGAQENGLPLDHALLAACLESLHDALAAGPLGEGDYSAWSHVFDLQPADTLLRIDGQEVCALIDSIPSLDEWFRLTVRGQAEVNLAWEARGSGWANTVNEEQWGRFRDHLTSAHVALDRAAQLKPTAPEPPLHLIQVALGEAGIEDMRRQFDATVKVRFDCIAAYEKFRWGLRPRWFGSEEAVIAFGRNCLSTQRFDTDVPWQMFRAVEDVADDQDDAKAYLGKAAPWADLQTMFDGYLQHGDPTRRNYYLSHKVVLAAKRGLDSEVAQLLKELNYQIDPQVREDWNSSVEWVGRMTVLTGPACHFLQAAERAGDANVDQALKPLLAAQKVAGLPPAATRYLAHRVAEMQALSILNQAQWQPLGLTEDLAGWKAAAGEWKMLSPEVLETHTDASRALLTRMAPIGDTWELRGEFQVSTQHPGRVDAVVLCGPPDDLLGRGFSLRYFTRTHADSGISLARGLTEAAHSKYADFQKRIPFHIRLANHRLRVWAENELPHFADQPLPEGVTVDAGAVLGLGAAGGPDRTVQFRKLEWRAPAPTKAL